MVLRAPSRWVGQACTTHSLRNVGDAPVLNLRIDLLCVRAGRNGVP